MTRIVYKIRTFLKKYKINFILNTLSGLDMKYLGILYNLKYEID